MNNTIAIFDTGFAWNWLATLNNFISGITWGAGLILIMLVFFWFVNKYGGKK